MDAGGGENLDKIVPPLIAPGNSPESEGVSAERDQYSHARVAASLTPTERYLHANQQVIDELRADRDRYRGKADTHSADLDDLRPRCAVLDHALKGINATLILGAVGTAAGGGIMSYATFVAATAQPRLASFGLGVLLLGCVVQCSVFYNKWITPPRK